MNAITKMGLWLVVFVALYVLGALMSNALIRQPDEVALIWIPSGLAFGVLAVFGLRWWPFIAIAVLITHLLVQPTPMAFLPFSVAANVGQAVAGAWLLHRILPQRKWDFNLRLGLRVLYVGGMQVLLGAVVGVAGLVFAGVIDWPQVPISLIRWMLGNLFGILTMTPPVMTLLLRLRGEGRRPPFAYAGPMEQVAAAVCLVVSLLLMLWLDAYQPRYALGLAFLPLALLIWFAIRFEPLRAYLATLCAAMTIAAFAGFGIGGFSPPRELLDSSVVVLFLSVFTVVPQVLVATNYQTRAATAHLLRRATTDPLTKLPNRAAFAQQVRERLAKAEDGQALAMAYIDLDQFKVVNDIAGHQAGDELVRLVAGAIHSHLHKDEVLARIGGDEFGILLGGSHAGRARERMETLRQRIAELRLPWGEHVLSSNVSIGLVPFQAGSEHFEDLFARADTASFTAKELGGNRVQVATLDTSAGDDAVRSRTTAMRWAMRLTSALDHGHFQLFCQSVAPLQAELASGRHFEVLVRMLDEDRQALLLPGHFMPAAERFHLSVRLDRHVVDRTLAWLEEHPIHAEGVHTCSINLSAPSVDNSEFRHFLHQRLASSSVPAHKICFELTETSAVRDLARAQRFIASVRGLGCRFALDDFGTGFCSFAYLQALDVDYFKIDGSFVRHLHQSPLSEAIVRSIARIAKVLNKQTIAECVETPIISERLKALHVDYAQGYAIDRPQPIDAYFARTLPRPLAAIS